MNPGHLSGIGSEEHEAFRDFRVGDMDGDAGEEDSDNFWEGDDEEDGSEGDDAPGPLESFIFVTSSVFNDRGFGLEGLEGHDMVLALSLK